MSFDNYKFVLKTCASSENEVTGEDIDLEDRFECDLKGVNLKEGVSLFSPMKEEWKQYGIENYMKSIETRSPIKLRPCELQEL